MAWVVLSCQSESYKDGRSSQQDADSLPDKKTTDSLASVEDTCNFNYHSMCFTSGLSSFIEQFRDSIWTVNPDFQAIMEKMTLNKDYCAEKKYDCCFFSKPHFKHPDFNFLRVRYCGTEMLRAYLGYWDAKNIPRSLRNKVKAYEHDSLLVEFRQLWGKPILMKDYYEHRLHHYILVWRKNAHQMVYLFGGFDDKPGELSPMGLVFERVNLPDSLIIYTEGDTYQIDERGYPPEE